ncbi:hypothetical protein BH24ACT23_BH24ACT23_06680 [soil metagenome]
MAETSARGTVDRAEPSKAERAAARRVAESKATVPHLYMTAELLVTRAQALIAKEDGPEMLDVIIRAAALALRQVPQLNGAYRDGGGETYGRVNVGVTVAGAEAPVVPTIFDADSKSVAEIGAERRALTARAGAGELTAAELAGGTFTIAGSGPSISAYAPVIHGAQAANIGLGAITERAVEDDGGLRMAPIVVATLVADARIVLAAGAADFLDRLRSLIEEPDRLA